MTFITPIPNLDDLILRHRAGESVLQLAKEAGVSRVKLVAHFQQRGVEVRGRSDAGRLRWQRDRAGLRRLGLKGASARRGQTNSLLHRRRVAAALQQRDRPRKTPGCEAELLAVLRAGGFDVVPQLAVDVYNLDLAIPARRVAVELVAKPLTHDKAAHERQRLEYLVNAGWSVLYVCWRSENGTRRRKGGPRWTRYFDPVVIREEVIAFADVTSRYHAVRGCYRVIRGDGDRSALRGYEFADLPRI